MKIIFSETSALNGTMRIPGSKSYTHRAYLTAALLGGGQVLHPLECDDTRATLLSLQGFNCEFQETETGLLITKTGEQLIQTERFLVGESGTLLRFLIPICTVCSGPREVVLAGRGSLKERSNNVVIDSIRENNFKIKATGQEATIPVNCFPNQSLPDGPVKVAASTTSQLLSGWLLALAAVSGGEVELTTNLVSAPYVEMTAEVLRQAGVDVTAVNPDVKKLKVENSAQEKLNYTVPGDYSSAAFFIVGAALAGEKVTLEGLRLEGKQADSRIVDIMRRLGARIEWQESKLVIEGPFQPSGFEIDAGDCPDLVPILAVLGAQAAGPVKIKNISHLANKESDRINTTCRELEKIGLKIIPGNDEINIHATDSRLHTKPVQLDANNDHRLAMAFSILGICRGNLTVTGAGAVTKSYPDFFKDLAALDAKLQQK